jgi:tryptophan-rich sensory protein
VTQKRPFPSRAVLVAAASALAVAAIGGSLTTIGPWYRNLHKPGWTPPDAAFGVIWTLIFALATVSGVTAWTSARSNTRREWIIGLFALNGFLNILWSLVFFRLQRPDWGLIEVAPFWLSIAVLIGFIGRFSRLGGVLLLPYLAWVSIAAFLNYEIVHLNPPFAAR